MAIRYILRENRLTSDPDDYTASVLHDRVADLNAVADRMVERGSTVTRADILSVLEDFQGALESILLEGANVNLPFGNFSSSIRGVFASHGDRFDDARHQLVPTVTAGKRLKAAFAQPPTLEKTEAVVPMPNLQTYTDLNSGERDAIATPGGMGQIAGHRLRFDASAAEQGIFWIAEDGSETRVAVVGQNKPARLMFLVPELPAGEYALEVRSAFGDEVRSGKLGVPLTVAG